MHSVLKMEIFTDPNDFFSDWMNVSICVQEIFDRRIVVHFEYFLVYSSPFVAKVDRQDDQIISCNFVSAHNETQVSNWWLDLKEMIKNRLLNANLSELIEQFDHNYENRKYILYQEKESDLSIQMLIDTLSCGEKNPQRYVRVNIETTKVKRKIKKLSTLCLHKLNIEKLVFDLYHDDEIISPSPQKINDYQIIKYSPNVNQINNTYFTKK